MDPLKLLKSAWDCRKDWIRKEKLEAFRLVHGEGDQLPGLFIEFYQGSYLCILRDPVWVLQKEKIIRALQGLSSEILPLSIPHFFWVLNYSGAPQNPESHPIQTKQVREGDLHFEVRLGEGLHSGFFLDQRDNRKRIRSWAKGKTVLNLFCYTGAFTVAALKGGATKVTSVDLSKNYLKWLGRNLEHNRLEGEKAPTWALDVFEFLKRAEKRGEVFDLIILDPPTFSRGARRRFSTEKDLEELAGLVAKRLAPGGRMFVSVNTQGLTPPQFRSQLGSAVHPLGLKIVETFPLPMDFRLSSEEEKNPPLKSCLIA